MTPRDTDRTPTVLVVDDDEEIRDAVADLLAYDGFDVDVAVDGLDALHVLERGRGADVIVCDLDMPRVDGTTLVRTLRRRGFAQAVVIVSARFDLLATTSNLGQVYALGKPVDAERLLATLREALAVHN